MEAMLRDDIRVWRSGKVEKIVCFFSDDCVLEDTAIGIVKHSKKET